ncbi:MAG: hypothetical protein ACI814_003802, partial [Mariniblastus sp.]
MKLQWIITSGTLLALFLLAGSNAVLAQTKSPEQKPGYDKSKDTGSKAPQGADVPFDGSQKSIKA